MWKPRTAVPAIVTFLWLAVGLTPAAAEIWGVKTHDPVSQPPSMLFRLAADGTALTVVGEVRLDGNAVEVDALALARDGTLYGFQTGGAASRLLTIDPLTAAATARGPSLAGAEFRGAAFTAAGRLLVLDAYGDALLEVDSATGEPVGAALPLTLDESAFAIGNMTDLVETAPGNLVLVRFNEFYAIDTGSGALTRLHVDTLPGPDGVSPGAAGLAWMPGAAVGPRLVMYEVQHDDDIYAYDPAASYARTDLFLDIIASYNAGRGDLASAPPPVAGVEGLPSSRDLGSVRAYPNPFNPRTTVTFTLAAPADVRVTIYDLAGRLVAELTRGPRAAGRHELPWDGRDRQGDALASGLYVCRVRAGAETAGTRLVLLR